MMQQCATLACLLSGTFDVVSVARIKRRYVYDNASVWFAYIEAQKY